MIDKEVQEVDESSRLIFEILNERTHEVALASLLAVYRTLSFCSDLNLARKSVDILLTAFIDLDKAIKNDSWKKG